LITIAVLEASNDKGPKRSLLNKQRLDALLVHVAIMLHAHVLATPPEP
jgi:hypothetical protein